METSALLPHVGCRVCHLVLQHTHTMIAPSDSSKAQINTPDDLDLDRDLDLDPDPDLNPDPDPDPSQPPRSVWCACRMEIPPVAIGSLCVWCICRSTIAKEERMMRCLHVFPLSCHRRGEWRCMSRAPKTGRDNSQPPFLGRGFAPHWSVPKAPKLGPACLTG